MDVKQVVAKLQWRCQGKYRLRSYLTDYLTNCLTYCQPIQIITLWCLSRSLSDRFLEGFISPLNKEVKVIQEMKWLHELLAELGCTVMHYIYLVGSSSDRGFLDESVSRSYEAMLKKIIETANLDAVVEQREVALVDKDVLFKMEVIKNSRAWEIELDRRFNLAEKHNYSLSPEQAYQETYKSVAVKMSEARSLVVEWGDFIVLPVESINRYQFHELGQPGFVDRLLPCLTNYPWR
ncbi:MAG: hypothetical protein ACOZAJ_03460 [Patescibacteria group bacterium]